MRNWEKKTKRSANKFLRRMGSAFTVTAEATMANCRPQKLVETHVQSVVNESHLSGLPIQ